MSTCVSTAHHAGLSSAGSTGNSQKGADGIKACFGGGYTVFSVWHHVKKNIILGLSTAFSIQVA